MSDRQQHDEMRETPGVDIFENICSLEAVSEGNHIDAVVVEEIQCQQEMPAGGWGKSSEKK